MVLLVVSMTVTIQWGDFIIRLCEIIYGSFLYSEFVRVTMNL